MTDEIWRPIPGWPNYEVSSLGSVRSLDRQVPSDNQWGKHIQNRRGRVLKASLNGEGYLMVVQTNSRRFRRARIVHRLVAECFLGEQPDGLVVDHIDGNKINNKVSNLRYVTRSYNGRNRVALKGCTQTKGGMWSATIRIDGKSIYLGTFPTQNEALAKRRVAQLQSLDGMAAPQDIDKWLAANANA